MKLNTVLVKPLDAPDWIYVPHETFPLKAYAYFLQRKKEVNYAYAQVSFLLFNIGIGRDGVGKKQPTSAQHIYGIPYKTRCTSSSSSIQRMNGMCGVWGPQKMDQKLCKNVFSILRLTVHSIHSLSLIS